MSELERIEQGRIALYELMCDINDIGPAALHCVLAETNAIIEYDGGEVLVTR